MSKSAEMHSPIRQSCTNTRAALATALEQSEFGMNRELYEQFFVPQKDFPGPPACKVCNCFIGEHGENPDGYLVAGDAPDPATLNTDGSHRPIDPVAEDRSIVRLSSRARNPGVNAHEVCSVVFGWVASLYLWLHIIFFIPICETDKESLTNESSSFCRNYYGHYDLRKNEYKYHWYFWVILIVVYLIYMSQSIKSPTGQALKNQLDIGAPEYITKLWHARPECWFHIQCWHNETRTRTVTDSKGHTRTETYTERVNTHSATGHFNFSTFQTLGDGVTIPAHEPVVRLRLEKTLAFADKQTLQSYESQYASFVAANDRDVHKDTSRGMNVPGYFDYTLAFKDPKNKPFGFSYPAYVICSLLTFSIPYRHFVLYKSAPVDWNVIKEVSI